METKHIVVVAPPWFDVPPLAYGGAEAVCYDLVQGLVARGFKVTLIGVGDDHTDAVFIQTSRAPREALGTPERLTFELAHAAHSAALVEQLQPDLVHDHSLAGPLTAAGRPWPTVVTVHGAIGLAERVYYGSLSRDVSLVAISDSQRILTSGVPWAGMVHNGIRVSAFPFRAAKDDFVLFLGRLSADKGPDLAIDAAREAGIDIVVAAKNEEPGERRFFREKIEPRLGPGVRWVGEVSAQEKRELLSRARGLVSPIRWSEPFGLVLVEAMACGTPVVALRRGSVPEIVIDGRTGFVVDDEHELPEALGRLAEIDPAACRRHVETTFSVGAMVDSYVRIYRDAMARATEARFEFAV